MKDDSYVCGVIAMSINSYN